MPYEPPKMSVLSHDSAELDNKKRFGLICFIEFFISENDRKHFLLSNAVGSKTYGVSPRDE